MESVSSGPLMGRGVRGSCAMGSRGRHGARAAPSACLSRGLGIGAGSRGLPDATV